MSWTGGFAIASARDVAKFYWDLVGPNRYILSEESYKAATEFQMLDVGFAFFPYGAGLMLQSANLTTTTKQENYTMNDTCTIIGHAGNTYGFGSMQGYFPVLNYSMSIIVTNDWDFIYPSNVFCRINSVIMKHMGRSDWDTAGCLPPIPPTWSCDKKSTNCISIGSPTGTSKETC